MNIVLNLQRLDTEETSDSGASTISLGFVCKVKSTISLWICIPKS